MIILLIRNTFYRFLLYTVVFLGGGGPVTQDIAVLSVNGLKDSIALTSQLSRVQLKESYM